MARTISSRLLSGAGRSARRSSSAQPPIAAQPNTTGESKRATRWSCRARLDAWLDESQSLEGLDHDKAKNALFWAAMTYTVAAIASIGQLLYYVMRLMDARR